MRVLIALGVMILSCFHLQAENILDSQAEFDHANTLYSEAQYLDAAKVYEEILKQGVTSELFYNLANSYYQANELGLAILNYERAIRLQPNFKDAKYNLKVAQERVVDYVDSSPEFWFRRFTQNLIKLNSSNGWVVFSFLFFLIMLFGFLVFSFARVRLYRKLGFHTMIVSFFLFVSSFTLAGVNKKHYINHNQAIVMNATVVVRNAPDKASTDLFQLHEGTKIKVRSTLAEWVEISLENGAIGWVEESKITRI